MSKDLTEIIKHYVEIDTSYAISIKGKYGIGKTYYMKNVLFPELEKIDVPHTENKKYRPIHLSLFGIKNIQEIKSALLAEVFPILKDKKLNIGGSFLKTVGSAAGSFFGVGGIKELIEQIGDTAADSINMSDLIICVDDLDRKNKNLEWSDVFGFLNQLTENQKIKVLIVVNEDEIAESEKKHYKTHIEKVVSHKYEFDGNINEAYESLIAKESEENEGYSDFLRKNKAIIINTIKKHHAGNIRTLKVFIEYFRVIFKIVDSQQDDNLRSQKENALLLFSLAISIELKKGSIDTKTKEELENPPDIFLADLANALSEDPHNEEKKKSYVEKFKEKYYSKDEPYYYFDSILNYFLGVSMIDEESLNKDLNQHFRTINGEVPEQDQILQKLSYLQCFDLSNNEYRSLTKKMIGYAKRGEYTLVQFPTVFQFATRFNNILNFDFGSLIKDLKKGIEKVDHEYTRDVEFRMSLDRDHQFMDETKEIINACNVKNEKVKNYEELKEKQSVLRYFNSDEFENFLNILYDKSDMYRYNPLWDEISVKKVYSIINILKPSQIQKLSHYFLERNEKIINPDLKQEKPFLKELKERIDRPEHRKRKNLRNITLDSLSSSLDKGIAKLTGL